VVRALPAAGADRGPAGGRLPRPDHRRQGQHIDENPTTPTRFFIRGIPTLLLFKNGDLKETIVGLANKDDLSRVIDKHLGQSEEVRAKY
jgi:hypothetical protein